MTAAPCEVQMALMAINVYREFGAPIAWGLPRQFP